MKKHLRGEAKKTNELLRMETLINSDRMKNSDDFNELLTADVDRVLRDYFDYKGYPELTVIKNGGAYAVKITLAANGIRAFSSLPPEEGNVL